MAEERFRDRFWSPQVARAATSPGAIVAVGAGAALGIVATAPVSVPLAIVGAVVGGLVGFGSRVALAIPRKQGAVSGIDPFGVNEPWRHAVQDALQARRRFTEAMKTFRTGPLHDSVSSVGGRIDEAVQECWRIAQQGQVLADARRRIDDREVQWELQQAAQRIPPGGEANATQARVIDALRSQLESASRMDALISSTFDELTLLNARLDESVTRAIELSVSNRRSDFDPVGADVEAIVDDLESLRLAITDLDAATRPGAVDDLTGLSPTDAAAAELGLDEADEAVERDDGDAQPGTQGAR